MGDIIYEMNSQLFKSITRWMGLMVIGGLALGFSGLAAAEWAARFIADPTDSTVAQVAPIILTMGTLVAAPALAATIGMFAARRSSARTVLVEAAVGSLIGSVLYALIAAALIGRYSQYGDAAPAFTDVATIAGLVALTSVVAGVGAVLATPTASDRSAGDRSDRVASDHTPESAA